MLSALMLTEKAVRKEYWEGAELSIKTLVFTHGSTHLDNPPPAPRLGLLVTRIWWLRGIVCTLSSCALEFTVLPYLFFKIGFYTHTHTLYIFKILVFQNLKKFRMSQEFRIRWRELCQCFLINNRGSVSSSEAHRVPCLHFKEIRGTYIYTIEKGIHVCLFKAECLHGVLLQRLGHTDFSALVFFTLLPTCTHCMLRSWKRII